MSMGGDPDLNIVQRILLEFDRGSAQESLGEAGKFVVKKMGEIEEEAGKLRASKAKESVKRYARAHMEAMEKVAKEEIKLVNKTLNFITKTELEEQRRRNEKLATTQRNAWKRRLADNKAHHDQEMVQVKGQQKRLTEAAIAGGRARVNTEKEVEKRKTVVVKEESSKRLKTFTADLKDQDRVRQTFAVKERQRSAQEEQRKTSAQKQAERERTIALTTAAKLRDRVRTAALRAEQSDRAHAHRLTEQKERAHHQRMVNRYKAFWSLLRTTNETGQRAIVNAAQSHFRRLHADRRHEQSVELADTRRHENRRLGIFRSSYREQQTIVSRSMVRQQGIIASSSQQATRGITGSFLSARNLLLGAGGFLSARAIFGPVADYQQTEIAFEALLGSAERADRVLGRLRSFAETTPFSFEGVAEGARRLLAVGTAANDVIPALTDIGNVAATLGAGEEEINGVIRALGQMRGKGKASAEELQQISEQLPGFSAINAIAEELGVTTREAFTLMREGAISGEVGVQAILQGMREFPGAAGAMERQSKTLNGRISTLKDTITNLLIDSLGPMVDRMADATGVLTTFLEQLFRGSGVFAVIRSGLLGIAAAAGVLLSLELVKFLRIFLLGLNPLVIGIVALGAGMAILIRHVPAVSAFFKDLASTVQDFALEKLEGIKEFFVGIGPIVQEAMGLVIPVLQDFGDAVSNAFGALLEGDFSGFTDLFSGAVENLRSSMAGVFTKVAETLEPITSVVAEFFRTAFQKAQDFIEAGGVDLIVTGFLDMLSNVASRVRDAAGQIMQTDLFKPMLAGLGVLLATSVLGIGLGPIIIAGLAAGLLAVSPTARERITDFFGNVFDNVEDFVTGRLPLLLLGGLYAIGNFIGGPLVAGILSETGIKIMAGIAAGIVAAGGALLFGLIDGLRNSIPRAAEAISNILGDLITAGFEGLQDAFGPLAEILTPLEVLLRGIGGSLEVLANIFGAIPTPIYLTVAAVIALTKAWKGVQTLMKAEKFTSFVGFFTGIPAKIRNAGLEMTAFGQNLQGFHQRTGRAIEGVGVGISAVGKALPGIATAAAIGLPIVTGLMATAKQRTEAWKQEVKDLQQAMFGAGNSISTFISTEAVDQIDGLAEALAEVNLQVADLQVIANGTAADLGLMFADIAGPEVQANLAAAGISMQQFGAAVAEGDQAVQNLETNLPGEEAQIALARVIDSFKDLPGPIRDVVDQTFDAADAFLEQQLVTGALTDEQTEYYRSILAGEAPAGAQIDLANEITTAQTAQARAFEGTREQVDELIQTSQDAADVNMAFRDSINAITGSAIEVGRAQQSVEGTFDAIAEGIEQGQGLNQLNDQFLSAADGIISVFETLTEAGRPREAREQYNRLRGELIQSYTQLGLNATQAEAFADALVPNVAEIRSQMREARQEINRQLREQRRNLRDALAREGLSPETRAAISEGIADINVELLASGGVMIPIEAVTPEDSYWADYAAMQSRVAADHPVTVPITPGPPPGGARGNVGIIGGMAGASGLTTEEQVAALLGTGGGGVTGPELNLDNITVWQEDIAILLDNVASAFETMKTDVTATVRELGRSIERSFGRTMNDMHDIGKKGANRTVNAITGILRAGAMEVASIVSSYARALANSLNPLLAAIGEPKIPVVGVGGAAGAAVLQFAQGGYSPEMAAGSAGPQVHVFNEASSHGEAYIPFDPKHKGRARDIADKSARRLGGRVQWFAEGGISTPVANVTGDWQGLHPEFARRLSTWATALGDVYNVTSGFRTHDEQVAAWNRYQAGTGAPAAVPGTSLHEFGLAADGPHWSNRNPAMQRLTYPMSYEPWHVQPVEGRDLTGGGIMMPQIPQPPDAGAHGVLSRLAEGMMQWAYDKIMAYASSQSLAPPGLASGVDVPGNVASWIRQAMELTGVPSSWFNALVARAMQESSGNPRAINLTDSNAAAGHPSMGLMQTIMSTFQAYALPGMGDIWNPVHNAAAAIRYIIARYGSVFNLPAGGYANGGVITQKQMAWLGEDGPEVVLPLTRPARLQTLLRETGLDRLIAQSLLDPNRPDVESHLNGSRSTPSRKIDLNLNFEGLGGVDPILHSELVGAVRSGVADGISRAEALEERWS